MSGIAQKYSNAVNSSCLTDDERHHSTDALAAVALSSEFGSLLFRTKYADDKWSIPELIRVWRLKIAQKAEKRGWPQHARVIADESLNYWLDNICRVCDGKGHPKVITAPTLEACVCQACNGTARRPLSVDPAIRDHVRDALQQLESMEREAGSAALKKLSDEMRLEG